MLNTLVPKWYSTVALSGADSVGHICMEGRLRVSSGNFLQTRCLLNWLCGRLKRISSWPEICVDDIKEKIKNGNSEFLVCYLG